MKILVLADIDDLQWHGGRGRADILLALGDLTDAVILQAAEAWKCQSMLAIKGNHDIDAPFPAPIVNLHLQSIRAKGLRFGGLNGCLQYKPCGAFLYYQEEIEAFLETFPAVDVFISHNSPRGIHDREDEVHTGFTGLNSYIERTAPQLLLHGHQHRKCETQMGNTRVIGVYGREIIEI